MHPVAYCILSTLSTASTLHDIARTETTLARAELHAKARCPWLDGESLDAMQGIVAAINATDCKRSAMLCRLEGDIQNAMRYEDGVARILAHAGL
jgi:hypothetical protein